MSLRYTEYKSLIIGLVLVSILFFSHWSTQCSIEAQESNANPKEDRDLKGNGRIAGGGADKHAIKGEYIVKLKDWGDKESREKILGTGPIVGGKLGRINAMKVKVSGEDDESFIQRLSEDVNVDWIEPNYIITVEFSPNDPSWGEQEGPRKIFADAAWDVEQGTQDVVIVIIDTGVSYNHPDLSLNYVDGGYDWINDDSDPIDDHGHGTHCAGIAAALINNGIGIAGLAQVKVMSEKFLGSSGSGTSWGAAMAISHAVEIGKEQSNQIILSNSWSSAHDTNVIKEAVVDAYNNGALIVAAAGNAHSSEPSYPAAYPEVISVSATDFNDNLASFSNYGNTIELAAPGVSIYSTYINDGYTSMSGTSMACPHVSGVAALIWSKFPSYSNIQVRALLQSSADDRGNTGWDQYYGYGRVNAYRALQGIPPHDIRVAQLELPPLTFAGENIRIGSSIQNLGSNTETNIEVQLLINDAPTITKSVPNIESGEVKNLEFNWKPAIFGEYNINISATPVEDEALTENNWISQKTIIQEAGNILIVSDDDASYFIKGTSVNEISSALTKHGYIFNIWSESTYGRPSLEILSRFRTVIWSCGDYWGWAVDPIDADVLVQYMNTGGSVLLEGADIGITHKNDDLMKKVAHATIGVDITGADSLTVTDSSHPICYDIPQSFEWSTDPMWEDGVNPTNGGKEVVKYTDTSFSAVVASGEGGPGSTVYISFPLACLDENVREKIIINSVRWLQKYYIRIESTNPEISNLKVYVDKVAYELPTSVDLQDQCCCLAVWPTFTSRGSEYVFDHWKNEAGQQLSDQLSCKVNVQSGETIIACFKKSSSSQIEIISTGIDEFTIGEEKDLEVTVLNSGEGPVNNVIVKLIHTPNLELKGVEGAQAEIGSISAGESYNLAWRIVPVDTGTSRLVVTVNGRDEGDSPIVDMMRLKIDVAE